MSILITGMEMPTSCAKCKLFGEYGCPFIGAVGYALTRGERSEDCPLVHVPPHGRLIDEKDICDKIRPLIENPYCYNRLQVISETLGNCLQIVRDAPTIIPAEEGE